jgi:DNA-binding MarR family transcriptional regulator
MSPSAEVSARSVPKRRSGRAAPAGGGLIDDVSPLPCTGARARRLTRRLTSFYEHHLRGVGITLPQYSLLMRLSDVPQPLTRLAQCLEMDRTTLTRNLRPLLERGWVEETAGPDARRRLLLLTRAGARFRARANARWKHAQLTLENQLGRDFVAGLNARLEQALRRLKTASPRQG